MCSSPPSLALQLESFAKQAEFTVYHPFMTPSTVRRQSKCFLWPYLPFYVMQTPSCLLCLSPTLIYICILNVNKLSWTSVYRKHCSLMLTSWFFCVLFLLPRMLFPGPALSLSTWLTPTPLLRLTSDILSNRKPSLTSSLAQRLPLELPQSLGFLHSCSDHSRSSQSEE